jgi:hypothetical protein
VVPGRPYRSLLHRLYLPRGRVTGRVHVHLHGAFEEAPRRLENATRQVGVVLLIGGDLSDGRQPDRDADQPVGVTSEVLG